MSYGGMIVHDSYVLSIFIFWRFECFLLSRATAHRRMSSRSHSLLARPVYCEV